MNNYRYILEPYKGMNTRYQCPGCGKQKQFTRYVDIQTGEHLPEQYGLCNRKDKCDYHLNPYKDGYSKMMLDKDRSGFTKPWRVANLQPTPKCFASKVSYISIEDFKQSLKSHEENCFVKYLLKLLGSEITKQLIEKYFIGTSKHWKGATVFWQIDLSGKIRTGKIMLYSSDTGKRVKEPYNHVSWAHAALKLPKFKLQQCFFGEHLLKGNRKPVAIVESEKTAILASVYLPQFIWISAGSKDGLNDEKCKVLQGRNVILFPDLNGFKQWNEKAQELKDIALVTVSDLLECKASEGEKKQGLDLADYLIRFDYKQFALSAQNYEPIPVEQPSVIDPLQKENELRKVLLPEDECKKETQPSGLWKQKITDLEEYFKRIELPVQPIKINSCTTIINVSNFLYSHFLTLKANDSKRTFLPYLDRLQELKEYLSGKVF